MRLEFFATLFIIGLLCFLLQSTAFEQNDVETKEAVLVVLDEMKNDNRDVDGLNFRVRRAPKGGGGRKGGGGGGGRKGGGGGGGKGGGRGGGGGGKGGGRRGGGGKKG